MKYQIDGLEIHSNYKPRRHNFAVALTIFVIAFIVIDFFVQNYLSALIYTH